MSRKRQLAGVIKTRKENKFTNTILNPPQYKVNGFEKVGVYSDIKNNEEGRTIDDLSIRLRIEKPYLQKILDELMADMSIIKVNQLYYPKPRIHAGEKPQIRRL